MQQAKTTIQKIIILAIAWVAMANAVGYYSTVYIFWEDSREFGPAIASLILVLIGGFLYWLGAYRTKRKIRSGS